MIFSPKAWLKFDAPIKKPAGDVGPFTLNIWFYLGPIRVGDRFGRVNSGTGEPSCSISGISKEITEGVESSYVWFIVDGEYPHVRTLRDGLFRSRYAPIGGRA